jgi:hypothetical protein
MLDLTHAEKYLEHLIRVKSTKGLRAIKDSLDLDNLADKYYNIDSVRIMIKKYYVWAKFDDNGEIFSSLLAAPSPDLPNVFFDNFKNEETKFFNPLKTILELADAAFDFFEEKEIYTYLLIRPFELFNPKRFSTIEDQHPLNKFNSYYDEIIPAGQKSKWPTYNSLLHDRTYDVDLAVVFMSMKQQYRKYKHTDDRIHALTSTKTN